MYYHAKNQGCPWTKVDLTLVVSMTLTGKTNREIGMELGRTEASIVAVKQRPEVRARINGTPKTVKAPPKKKPAAKTPRPAMAAWPFPTTAKPLAKPKGGARWTEDDLRQLKNGWVSGHDAEYLAGNLGRTAGAVCAKLKGLGYLEFDKDEMAYFIPRKLYLRVA